MEDVSRLLFLVAASLALVACGSKSHDAPPPNRSPIANAGGAQTVGEATTVTLTGSGSDSDGTVASYSWSQIGGPAVMLQSANQATASFVAPNLPDDETFTFRLQVTDDDGATASATVDVLVLDNAPMLIRSLSQSFGLPGTMIVVEMEGADPTTTISFNGTSIVPESITSDSTKISFLVPPGGRTGPLKAASGSKVSNSIWFSVTDDGILPADPARTVIDSFGNRIPLDYVMVALFDSSDTRMEAERLAALVSGQVTGRLEIVNGWQISVPANTLAELEAFVALLSSDPAVEFASFDVEAPGSAVPTLPPIDWTKDPDHFQQRSRNRVEEGAALYQREVHPTGTKPSGINMTRPFFMSVGVSELGVDFMLDDFSGYNPSVSASSLSGNVALYSPQADASGGLGGHGSNVVGVIAAELEDMGNAGLIRALSDSHGGANIDVGCYYFCTFFGRISDAKAQLDSGVRVINWSWGVHDKDAITCTGTKVAKFAHPRNTPIFLSHDFWTLAFFQGALAKHPEVVIVVAAGNAGVDAGDRTASTPSSIVSDQMIVVGAHTTGGTHSSGLTEDEFAAGYCHPDPSDSDVKRAALLQSDGIPIGSNYGLRVDIAASGAIIGHDNVTYTDQEWGTSFAAPLVTATVALMQSINPNLTPSELRFLLRSSALPVQNTVELHDSSGAFIGQTVFTRPLTSAEAADPAYVGLGARLNVEGAIQAALDSLADETTPLGNEVSVTIPNGVSNAMATVSVAIPVGTVFSEADIVFLVDVSSSYNDDIATFRSKANELINAFSSVGTDVEIGLASFSDFPTSPYGGVGDYPYRLDQVLTTQFDDVRAALDALVIQWGGDGSESQLEALFQANQAGMGWRSGALPVIFLATDADFHDSDVETGYPGVGSGQVLSSLNSRVARVFGLQSGGTIQDVVDISTATGGEAFVLSRDSAEIVSAVQTALGNASQDLDVVLEPFGDFAQLVQSITPSVITGVNGGDTVQFNVMFTRATIDDNQTHTFSFRLRALADSVAVIVEVPVTVTIN